MIDSAGKLITQTSFYRKQKKKNFFNEPARACFNVSCQWNEGNRLKKNGGMPSWEKTELTEREWHARRLSWMLAVSKDMAMICLRLLNENNKKDRCFFIPLLFIQEPIMLQWLLLLFFLIFVTIAPWMCTLPCDIYVIRKINIEPWESHVCLQACVPLHCSAYPSLTSCSDVIVNHSIGKIKPST